MYLQYGINQCFINSNLQTLHLEQLLLQLLSLSSNNYYFRINNLALSTFASTASVPAFPQPFFYI